MSSDLSICLTRSLLINELFLNARVALTELLGVQKLPDFWIYELGVRSAFPPKDDYIHRDNKSFRIGFVNMSTDIELDVVELKVLPPDVPIDKAGWWLGLSVQSGQPLLAFALAAGIAISAARICNTNIIDDGTVWINVYEQHPDSFLAQLHVSGSHIDLEAAAKVMYNSMFKRGVSS